MNVKPPERVLRHPICTWLTVSDYETISGLAKANGVSMAAYVRAILVDAIEEERERFRVSAPTPCHVVTI